MRVGDLLEWLAGALLVLAAYLFFVNARAAMPVLVAALFLLYQAQCFAAHTLGISFPRVHRPRWFRRTPKAPKRDMSKVIVLPPEKQKRKKGRRK